MKKYHNPITGESYTEGNRHVRRLPDGTIFNAVPTVEQLHEWGFVDEDEPAPAVEYPPAVKLRLEHIQAELASMDYLTSKALDGEDMTPYGDWQARRRALRAEYRNLEQKYKP